MKMAEYAELIKAIVNQMKIIIGPVAITQANKMREIGRAHV